MSIVCRHSPQSWSRARRFPATKLEAWPLIIREIGDQVPVHSGACDNSRTLKSCLMLFVEHAQSTTTEQLTQKLLCPIAGLKHRVKNNLFRMCFTTILLLVPVIITWNNPPSCHPPSSPAHWLSTSQLWSLQ